ncbi:hypothetical protein [Vibrio sp. LaRot3]|uniref:hypothetical protein n=1 Tax=Vibrio sp. LaRot3 TaxID=2998829 RepID=UPI0022CDF80B|nr:hypothetical protein [Vibrio sp. LaRot3]MDA0149541.1 hypothetical protein [Vibrio sp. LaRot3]
MYQANVTIPTDNLYKFLTIAGLLLMLGGGYLFNLSNERFNDEFIELVLRSSELNSIANPTETEKLEVIAIEKLISIKPSDKKLEQGVSVGMLVFGFVAMLIGFIRWFVFTQPNLDRFLELQVQKLELENESLKSKNSNIG